MKVGFIGIGQMGVRMAGRILGAGHDLVVYDAKKEAAAPLLTSGAEWAETPKAVAEACRVVITCLPTPQIVEDVVCGKDGLGSGWRGGDVYIDMSTNSPSTIRRIAADAQAKGVSVLDAPVSGGTPGAERGTLTIMVGGEGDVLEQVRPVLEPMAGKIFHLGGVGCGNVAKLVNNMIGLTCNSACAEGFVLGVKAGMDPQELYELLTISTANNWSMQQYPRTVFKGDFAPGFKISLAHKDIGLALKLGKEHGVPLPVAEAVEADLAHAREAGLGEGGVDSVILPLEEAAGVQVRVLGQTQPGGPS
jgi:3-hydroxyisobutyrate dehydrogenase-like beta-hydroxyacid dehydrogenase